jgi:hypothetical protein
MLPRDANDYKFHSIFQLDFYESVITPKSKPVANSQWIDWAYMKNKLGKLGLTQINLGNSNLSGTPG